MISFIASLLIAPSTPSCSDVAIAELERNGVSSQMARVAIANQLVEHYEADRSANVVEIIARRQAERVSSDKEWINWAAWNARNAYEKMEQTQCAAR